MKKIPGAFGKKHEWTPYKWYGRLPKAAQPTLGQVGAFFALDQLAEQQRLQRETNACAFNLGKLVERRDALEAENAELVKELDRVEAGKAIIQTPAGTAILNRIVANNKARADLKSQIAEKTKKLRELNRRLQILKPNQKSK